MEELLLAQSLPTALQIFTQHGGLALLAQHLPPVYPETLLHFGVPDRTIGHGPTSDQADSEGWVKVEASDDIYEVLKSGLYWLLCFSYILHLTNNAGRNVGTDNFILLIFYLYEF